MQEKEMGVRDEKKGEKEKGNDARGERRMETSLDRKERWGKGNRRGDKQRGEVKLRRRRGWLEYTGIILRVTSPTGMVQNIFHNFLCPGISLCSEKIKDK